MAKVFPFRSFRFDVDALSEAQLERFVSFPYDGIEQDSQDDLRAGEEALPVAIASARVYPSPLAQHNIYSQMRRRIMDWLAQGVLKVDPEPMCYIYHQRFVDLHGRSMTRRGLIARVGLAEYEERVILPHEHTLRAPKADRLELMKATEANLSQIFMLYSDPEHAVERLLTEVVAEAPLMSLTTEDGIIHELWGVCEGTLLGELSAWFEPRQLLIADGHHRYETALAYRDFRRAGEPHSDLSPRGEAPYEYIMTLLVNMHDPGLLVLPTHRVVHGVRGFDFKALLETMRRSALYHVERLAPACGSDPLALLRACEISGEAGPSFVLLAPGDPEPVLARYLGSAEAPFFDPTTPPSVRALDVSILHEGIFDALLGIDREAQAAKANLRYKKRADEALAELHSPDTQLVVLMNATPVSQILEVCHSGGRMPQKSTYFYPKILNGLMLCPL